MQAVSRAAPTTQVMSALVILCPTLSSGEVMLGHPVPFRKPYGPMSVGNDVGVPTTEQPSLPSS
jgi:hypothetical protein